jgi:conjugal transfer pilus assembly protein TraV
MAMTIIAGCSAVGEAVNPYKSKFNCPYVENGKCINMTGAYNESKQPEDRQGPAKVETAQNQGLGETIYEESLYKKLSGLLQEPAMPVIAPPKVMRVLLLPYEGSDKELFMYRFAYSVVDDYSWVLDDNVVGEN